MCLDAAATRCNEAVRWPGGRHHAERAVRSPLIVVGCVLLQDEPKVPLVDDEEVVQTLTPQGADQALGDGVRLGAFPCFLLVMARCPPFSRTSLTLFG
jgi:hypothetical protein